MSATHRTIPQAVGVNQTRPVRFISIDAAEFAIDWMLKELIRLNPKAEAHYRKVAHAQTMPPVPPGTLDKPIIP